MAIRLLKACKDLNIGISTAVYFCKQLGKEIAMDVNSRIDDELYLRLAKEFNKDLALKLEAKSQEREIPKAENNKISLIDIVDMVKESKNRPNREGTQNETTDSKSLEKITSNQDTTKNNIENNTPSNEVMEKNKKEKYGLMKYGNCGTKAEQNKFINQVQEFTGLTDLTFGKISNYLGEVKQENDILYIETELTTTENEQLFFTFHKTPEDLRYEWGNLSVQTLKEKHKNSNTLNFKDLGRYGSEAEQRLLEELNLLTGKSIKSISILSQHLTTYEDIDKLRLIHSNLVDTNGNPIVFWFVQDFSNKNVYTDFECGLLSDFELKKEIVSSYQWGKNIFFSDPKKAHNLLDDVKSRAMPEQWSWDKNAGKGNLDILQSYLTYTFTKLLNEKTSIGEGKNQANGKTIVAFNTNLMDKRLVDIFIAGEKIEYKKGYLLKDPHLVKKQDLMRYEINYEFLPPPTYFTNITDIIFNTDWKIADDNDEKMGHVLKRKDKRIKKEITISQLHTAITFSRKMAQRNYKYIVPMYYPEKNRIQLLMPLYFEGEYKDEPDGVLILTPDADTKFYVPETIIGLREAYMDARLISKPDNAWLEPSSLRKKENKD